MGKNLRLAKYKSLSLKKDAESQKLMKEIEELLLESGFTKEQLQLEVENYAINEFPCQEEVIKNKAQEIMYDITKTLKEENPEAGYISTIDYPEYYYRIQEVLMMDSDFAAEVLEEAERRANIEHTSSHSEDLQGNNIGGYTYYFSKKVT